MGGAEGAGFPGGAPLAHSSLLVVVDSSDVFGEVLGPTADLGWEVGKEAGRGRGLCSEGFPTAGC